MNFPYEIKFDARNFSSSALRRRKKPYEIKFDARKFSSSALGEQKNPCEIKFDAMNFSPLALGRYMRICYEKEYSRSKKLQQICAILIEKRDELEEKKRFILELDYIIAAAIRSNTKAQKNMRYIQYAQKWKIPFTMENLILLCNKHRNIYIAFVQYMDHLYEEYPIAPEFYSGCVEKNLNCNGLMYYDGRYDSAKFLCGKSSWNLSFAPPIDSYDILQTVATSNDTGYSLFEAILVPKYENMLSLGPIILEMMFSDNVQNNVNDERYGSNDGDETDSDDGSDEGSE